MERSDSENILIHKLKKCFPTYDDAIEAIRTSLGTSASLAQFIHDYCDCILEIPEPVRLAIALTSINLFNLFEPDLENRPYLYMPTLGKISDQKEEEILRNKLVTLVEYLYKKIQQEKSDARTS